MNLRKTLLHTMLVLLGTVMFSIICTTTSQASIDPTGKLLNMTIPTYRKSGYAYKVGINATELQMWKIYEYNDNKKTIKNQNNAIYCIKMGVGFGSTNGSKTEPRKYTKYADMKNPTESDKTEIIQKYIEKNLDNSDERYNSLIWVLDHCYVPEPSETPTDAEKQAAEEYKKLLLESAGISSTSSLLKEQYKDISNDLIDIVQQIAIWYFTNSEDDRYHTEEFNNIVLQNISNSNSNDYKNLDDILDEDWSLLDDCKTLYKYFINGGNNNKNTPLSTTATNPIKLKSDNAKVTLQQDDNGAQYYIAGPYTLEKQENTTSDYTVSASITGANAYTLLNSSKQNVDINSLKNFAENEEQFYLKINKSDISDNIENIELKISTKVKQNTITYWEVEGNGDGEQPVVEIKPEEKTLEETVTLKVSNFDLALRKFIKSINGKELVDDNGKYLREPSVDITPLVEKTDTTANYYHPKNPVGVSVGDIVIYTLRIYNEGEVDGYASKVTDYLPPQLQFVVDDDEKFNSKYGWLIDDTLRKATTEYLAKPTIDPQDNIIKAFDGEKLDYKELQIKCKVVSTDNLDKVITNIAEITEFTDANGDAIVDRDSQKANIVLPNDADLPNYKGNESNKSILTDSEYFYKGQQDDDDFEKLILEQFDLALRKFITKVNDTDITNRIPKFTNVKDANGNYVYEHTKEPVLVESTDIVEYTLRIYNEGDIAGYAKEVRDDIPSGLEFLPNNETNQEYRWKMLDENGEETDDITKAVAIVTDYLSKEQESEAGDNLIKAFDSSKTSPDYKDIKVVFKVVALDSYEGIITNIAEISDDSDEEGKEVEDKDSTPKNNDEKEDDIDKEHLKLTYFDLALRKFITGVNEEEITDRVPQFTITEDGKYTYEHTKEPVEVENGDIVTYTLRIYNEGTKDGYAKEVKDDLPEGLEFLPDNEINQEYRWVMIDENGEETEDITEAVSIKTDYLSKEQEDLTERNNLLKKFDKDTMEEPDYRDIKIAFKVTEPNTSDRILINKAQISDDSDENGKDVIDKDSTPDRWVDGEDDQDIEKVKVKYFDLALRKWVTEAIVIDDGKETITQTGHKAEDDPEEVVKVEIKESRLNKVVVKFRYKIRVTNEGEIAGYATEISDYIPEGLRFVQEDNPTWKEVDGKVVTDELKDTLLQPGESAEVEILLTWINGKNNFNLKINTAEISKDKNPSDTPDIDSTPNNKEPEEDDIDDAPVILSIKTGALINLENITLITISLAIIASGVILIKKYILE